MDRSIRYRSSTTSTAGRSVCLDAGSYSATTVRSTSQTYRCRSRFISYPETLNRLAMRRQPSIGFLEEETMNATTEKLVREAYVLDNGAEIIEIERSPAIAGHFVILARWGDK